MPKFRTVEHRSALSPHVRSRVVTALAPVGERPGGSDVVCRDCGHHVCSCAKVWVNSRTSRVHPGPDGPGSRVLFSAGEPLSIGDLVCLRDDGKAYCVSRPLARPVAIDPPDALPANWYAAGARESGLFRHTSDPCIAVAETNARGDLSWRLWTGGAMPTTAHRATRAEAMCAALGYDTAKISEYADPFFWCKPTGDFGEGWFASAELAALDALRFDAAQRSRGA